MRAPPLAEEIGFTGDSLAIALPMPFPFPLTLGAIGGGLGMAAVLRAGEILPWRSLVALALPLLGRGVLMGACMMLASSSSYEFKIIIDWTLLYISPRIAADSIK